MTLFICACVAILPLQWQLGRVMAVENVAGECANSII